MRLLYFLLFIQILTSCTDYAGDKEKKVDDSELVSELYEKSRDLKSPLTDRKKNIQEALRLNTQNDSLEAALLYSKSSIHFSLKEYDSAFYVGKKLKAFATNSAAYLSLGKYDHLLAYYHENIAFNIDSAFFYNNTSKNYFLRIPDSSRALKRILRQAILKNISNDFFGAKETLTEALGYLKTNNNKKDLALVYSELASNNSRLLNHSDAISYYQLAVQTSDNHKDILGYKNNLATTFTKEEYYTTAITLLKTVLEDTLVEKGTTFYARVLDNLAYAQWKNGTSNPTKLFFKALNTRKQKNDKRGLIASNSHLGQYYSKLNPKKAERYLDTLIQISKELKIPKAEQDALKLLMTLQPENVTIRNRYVVLQDSLYQVGLQVKTQFAKMKYDDEQKELAILQLKIEKALETKKLTSQQTQKTLLILFIFFLILGIILAYYGLRQRYKKEKLREVYETEKRISKVIHDELANDIYGIMTHLEHSKSYPKALVLDSLENIYNQTRDISHNNGIINTQHYAEELKKLLSQFRNEDTVIIAKGLNTLAWERVAEEKKITLYRILNELLVNMKKHSGATVASITFNPFKDKLSIAYADNGKGMKLPIEKGIGLYNTETRIKNLNGTISFESETEKGTQINFSFPI